MSIVYSGDGNKHSIEEFESDTTVANITTEHSASDSNTSSDHESQASSPDEDLEALYHNVCPPQSARREFNTSSTLSENTIFILNGLSSLGAHVAYALGGRPSSGWDILSIASTGDRLSHDRLMWYRRDKLREKGVPNVFVDWSNANEVGTLLKARRPRHVIVVPPSIDGGGLVRDSTAWSSALHDFVALLETLKTVSPATRVTLVSTSKSVRNELEVVPPSREHISLLETLVGAFELSMSTYHTLYHIPFTVLRFKGFYGPWTSEVETYEGCYIDDVVGIVYLALSLKPHCIVLDYGPCDKTLTSHYAQGKVGWPHFTDPEKGRLLTEMWRREYENTKNSRLILTSYFTGHGSHVSSNRFRHLQTWLESVTQHGLDAVVLHNGLGTDFITHCKQHYPRLSFELVSLPYVFGQNSSRFQSVQAFAQYLEHQSEVNQVIIMDVDRTIARNVFPAMELLGDWLYSDLDIVPFRDILPSSKDGPDSLMNSVVLGGNRHMVLATLNKIVLCSQSSGPGILQCLMDRHFVQHAFLGWPLSTAFMR